MNIFNINNLYVNCYGAESCFNICPKNVVEMIKNREGFYYPKINAEIYINCFMCYNICPIYSVANQFKERKSDKSYSLKDRHLVMKIYASEGYNEGLQKIFDKIIQKRNRTTGFKKNIFSFFYSYEEEQY